MGVMMNLVRALDHHCDDLCQVGHQRGYLACQGLPLCLAGVSVGHFAFSGEASQRQAGWVVSIV